MRKWIAATTIAASLVLAACGGEGGSGTATDNPGNHGQEQAKAGQQAKPKSKRDVQAEAPKQEESEPTKAKPKREAQAPEDNAAQERFLASVDAKAYYRAAAAGDYVYTHENLTEEDRRSFSRDEWVRANNAFGSDQATYEVTSVKMASPSVADVTVYVSGTARNTAFVLEDGTYKHQLTTEEYNLFSDALTSASATASATASASASASASAGAPAEGAGAGAGVGAGVGYRANGQDDVNCSDLPGPVPVGPEDEDDLDRDGDGVGCNS